MTQKQFTPADPDWLRLWQHAGIPENAALARFDSLPPPATPEEMLGEWRGHGLPTGHPLDGVLEHLGWRGKRFTSLDHVDPLLFEPGIALNPRLMPVGIALRWPRLAKSSAARAFFRLLRRALRTKGPAARLATVTHRASAGAAMIYDHQPIIDHFRRIDENRILGLMDMRGAAPYFFLLTKNPGSR